MRSSNFRFNFRQRSRILHFDVHPCSFRLPFMTTQRYLHHNVVTYILRDGSSSDPIAFALTKYEFPNVQDG
ncbi:Hypothetical predicted protein [Pelobates cultripes]|uniref:Uncharacterized protein n=1 Tax=Pelobates cultripes TaxID=61616 RepID=A0AAD1RY39_PELCU|nr:Hypothetical predicted protein [Pelobates cultripes]